MTDVRLLRADEVPLVQPLPEAAFHDLDVRLGHEPMDWTDDRKASFERRVRHFAEQDPDLQHVAVDDDGQLVGVALASLRDGLWGLSLLVVRPGLQAAGLGRRLMTAAMGPHTSGPGAICSSGDGRAMHRYAAAGFALHPALEAKGRPDLGAYVPDPHVRDGGDPDLANAVDVVARGAGHGPDHAYLLAGPDAVPLLYVDGDRRGYAYLNRTGHLVGLAATDEVAASALLWAALARTRELDVGADVAWVTGGQPWAVDVVVAAKLALAGSGAVCWRGIAEPRAYLPNGALL